MKIKDIMKKKKTPCKKKTSWKKKTRTSRLIQGRHSPSTFLPNELYLIKQFNKKTVLNQTV